MFKFFKIVLICTPIFLTGVVSSNAETTGQAALELIKQGKIISSTIDHDTTITLGGDIIPDLSEPPNRLGIVLISHGKLWHCNISKWTGKTLRCNSFYSPLK